MCVSRAEAPPVCPQSLQGLTGTPLVAGSPIRHESAVQGSAVEVQTYQPPWKALSEFALQSDLEQPAAFQQLVSPAAPGEPRRTAPPRRAPGVPRPGRCERGDGSGEGGHRAGPLPPLLPQVSFSESGSLGTSSGSDVTSLSSQLPDTPNSMVPSPAET